MNTFNERSYRAMREALLEGLAATVEELKRNSQIRREALKAAESPISNNAQPKPASPPRAKATPDYAKLKAQTLAAAEASERVKVTPATPPVPIVPEPPRPVTSGYQWIGGAWARVQPDPITTARQVALLATRNEPQIIKANEDTDTRLLAAEAHLVMRNLGQSPDPKSASYRENYKKALGDLTRDD